MVSSKVGRRGQTTIPKQIREQIGLQQGDRIAFQRRGDEILLIPLKKTLKDLRGSVPVDGPQDFESIRAQVRGERARRSGAGDA